MSALAALAAAAALLAAPPPAPAKGAPPAPRDPDADVVANLELLERLELLQHLDVLLPGPAPSADPRDDPAVEGDAAPGAEKAPPPRKGAKEKAPPAPAPGGAGR